MKDSVSTVAVYSGEFDPPTLHHRRIAERLAEEFDRVIVVPLSRRTARRSDESLPLHRAVMCDMTFHGLANVEVDLSDLERSSIFNVSECTARFNFDDCTVWQVLTAAELIGESEEQTEALQRVVVLRQENETIDESRLPAEHRLLETPPHSLSPRIRERIVTGKSVKELIAPNVAAYIERHGLFRPSPPSSDATYRISAKRIQLFYDAERDDLKELAAKLQPFVHADPEIIVVLGGDGTMLRAIRQLWRQRLPFYGLNAGHIGFLLNEAEVFTFWDEDLRLHQLPLLWVETTSHEGECSDSLAFNDCWLERESGQTAWIEVSVNGKVRMPKVVADGMLIATAAGSTSYARAMGAIPLPLNAPLLTLAGSNVLIPEFWQPAVLPRDTVVKLRNLDGHKRPLRGFIDGVAHGSVESMSIRTSRIAAVELLFLPERDPVEKLAMLQFPQLG